MKNKLKIMRTIKYFLYTLLVTVIFCGCEQKKTEQELKSKLQQKKTEQELKSKLQQRQTNEKMQGFTVIVVDSCEYIRQFMGSHNGWQFTHKGNCKYCIARNKK